MLKCLVKVAQECMEGLKKDELQRMARGAFQQQEGDQDPTAANVPSVPSRLIVKYILVLPSPEY